MIGKLMGASTLLVFVVPAIALLTTASVSAEAQSCINTAIATLPADQPISDAGPPEGTPVAAPGLGPTSGPASILTPAAPASPHSGGGCIPNLGTDTATLAVPPGTPVDTATAVRNALAYVGVRSGWTQLCDKLACRAYGYLNSGYVSARSHWQTMLARGFAHPADRCPPLGSFVFWDTGRPFGHVSLVVQADPVGCDTAKIDVTANEVFDAATGNHGGVYLLPFARLDHMYLGGHGYLGWSPPVCAGVLLPASTLQPVPAGG
ncbi:MAG TPA: hypothetical protein VGK17_14965 [Propionicimonas sp.]|jgi:hypothetical protein